MWQETQRFSRRGQEVAHGLRAPNESTSRATARFHSYCSGQKTRTADPRACGGRSACTRTTVPGFTPRWSGPAPADHWKARSDPIAQQTGRSFVSERRNLYRLLHLQPDAPIELVRVNYVTLMTKLERHPDLGGDHWNAASLGAAYTTLSDPKKRSAYDAQLLERYDLSRLARVPRKPRASLHSPKATHEKTRAYSARLDPDGNQRNYYRVLGVQQDAPGPVIESAYRALHSRSTSPQERALLDSAFCVLSDPAWRARYDEIEQRERHPSAAHDLKDGIRHQRQSESARERKTSKPPEESEPTPSTEAGAAEKEKDAPQPGPEANPAGAMASRYALTVDPSGPYQPLIRSYCLFCMTPHGQNPDVVPAETPFETASRCRECDSPLFSPPADLLALERRAVTRFGRDEEILLHVDWPAPSVKGRAIDISPTGLRCMTAWPIETGERVRIEFSVLRAVGEVAFYQRRPASPGGKHAVTEAGIRFLTVAFEKNKGGFFSVTG